MNEMDEFWSGERQSACTRSSTRLESHTFPYAHLGWSIHRRQPRSQ